MRPTSAEGMKFMSTPPPLFVGVMRRESSSVSVRTP
jgi:hypothetical protein